MTHFHVLGAMHGYLGMVPLLGDAKSQAVGQKINMTAAVLTE